MMKITHILICLIAFSLSSCLKEEVNIFMQSPAERLNLALKDDKTALINASNGWVMQYFANPTSAGYNLLVKFNASGKAVFAAKNEFTLNKSYVTDSSLFQLVGDNGPVLTFNTYNKILHVFSNPIDPNETPELTGFGLEGDYEFVVTKVTDDQITLKGKKHGSIIFLNKLQNNVSWLQYVQDLDARDSLMFSNVAPKLTMTIGKSTYSFSNGFTHIFRIQKDGGGSNLPFDAPFIITPSGIRFQSVQEIEGAKFQVLNLNTEKTALVSSDNPDIKLTGTSDLALYFASNASIVWKLVFDNSSQNISTLLNQIRQSCITKYNASDVKLSILWTPLHQYQLKLSFQVANQLNEGNLDLNISSSGKNALLFYYKTTGDVSGLTYYNEVTGLKELVSILSSGFVLSANTTLNFKEIKLTKKTDSNTWFTISK